MASTSLVGQAAVEPPSGGREQRAEVVARADLGQPRQGRELDHAVAVWPAGRRRSSTARVRGARPGRRARAERSAARSSGVSTSSPSECSSATSTRAPAARAVAAWRANEPGSERGLDRAGRGEQQRVGPGAVAVGDDHHLGVRGRAREQPGDLLRRERGAVAGDEQHALDARGRSAAMPRAAAADWPCSTGSWTTVAPARSATARGRGLGGHDDHGADRVDLPERGEHVRDHRRRELAPLGRSERAAEPLLGAAEALDGEDGGDAHAGPQSRSASANATVCWATSRRCSGVSSTTSVSSVGTPLARWSATRPSSSPE